MKTNVSPNSIKTYRQIGPLMADQGQMILNVMERGRKYTRRELGVLTHIENSASARAVNGLVKSGSLIEDGVKLCGFSGRMVGAVKLA